MECPERMQSALLTLGAGRAAECVFMSVACQRADCPPGAGGHLRGGASFHGPMSVRQQKQPGYAWCLL